MTAEQVKENLLKLYGKDNFNVVFTGKKDKRLNSWYNPETRTIFINDKNFLAKKGGKK